MKINNKKSKTIEICLLKHNPGSLKSACCHSCRNTLLWCEREVGEASWSQDVFPWC